MHNKHQSLFGVKFPANISVHGHTKLTRSAVPPRGVPAFQAAGISTEGGGGGGFSDVAALLGPSYQLC